MKTICVCCGGEVEVQDTWRLLSPEELAEARQAYPNYQFQTWCGIWCPRSFGPTPEAAIETFRERQQWGRDRIPGLAEMEAAE